jgi:hypothetical protein
MKSVFGLLLICTLAISAHGQTNTIDTCTAYDYKDVSVFIPGSVDTIQANGLRVKAIHAAELANGFELISKDSSINIISFRLVFGNREDGNLYSKTSKGNKILNDERIFSLSKIRAASLITIDKIIFKSHGICYKAKGQIYLCR